MVRLLLTSAVFFLLNGLVETLTLPLPLILTFKELAQVNECSEYKELSSSDRSVDYTDVTIDKCDAKLAPGWYRFTESAGSIMATRCIAHRYCSAIKPGWLNGSHPGVHEGVVGRTVCFQSEKSCCHGSMKVLVRNCGGFFVYLLFAVPCPFRYCGNHKFTTHKATTLRPPLPTPMKPKHISDECQNYTALIGEDRSASHYNPFNATGDYKLQTGWYRFMGKAGNKMADSCIPRFHCGTHAPGWLFGGHPNKVSSHAVTRVVCFNWKNSCCYLRQDILVRRCEGYFVYKLKRNEFKYLRYCGNGIITLVKS